MFRRTSALALVFCLVLTSLCICTAAETTTEGGVLPQIAFTAFYSEEDSGFEVTTEIQADGISEEAHVMAAVYKNNVFYKLLLNEKIDKNSVYSKRITRYSIVSDTEAPKDFEFRCFTLGENLKPLLPMYRVTGEEALTNSPDTPVKLRGVVMETSVLSLKGDKDIYTSYDKTVIVDITDTYETTNKDFPSTGDGYYIGDIDEFLIGDTDIENYLGMSVIMYVKEKTNGKYEVISVAPDTARNKILTFTLDQFDTVDGRYIKYFKNSTDSTSTKVQLSEPGSNTNDAIITLNGKIMNDADTAFNSAYGIEENGKTTKGGLVTLIDNDNKQGYDVVMIDMAATAVVDTVSNGTIFFKEQAVLHDGTMSQLEFDDNNTDTVIEIVKDGALIDYTDLAEWDVLSIIAPYDDNSGYIRVEVILSPVTGTITADKTSKTSATGKAYKVDGKYYDVAEGGYKTKRLSLGDSGFFYIDKYGKLAAFREDSAVATGIAGTYGYVYNTLVTDKNMDTEVQVKMVTANGVELMNFASSVSVNYKNNGKTTFKVQNITDSELCEEDATLYGATRVSDMIGQVVKFTKNSSGDIKTITFADYNDNFESVKVTAGKYQYDADTLKLGKFIDEDAAIFFIGTAADKCYVGTPADLSDNNSYEVLAMYADSKATDNNIVVIKGTNNTPSSSENLAVLTEVRETTDDNGNDILMLSYISENKSFKHIETIEDTAVMGADGSDMSADSLTVGDIVQIKVGGSGKRAGKITGITVLWDFREDVRLDSDSSYIEETFTSGDYDEILYGGAVTAAYNANRVYFGTDLDWNKVDGEGNTVPLKDQVSDWINIAKAKNIYTIQTATEGTVTVKKGGSFNYIKQMFDNTTEHRFFCNGEDTGVKICKASLSDYVDHVFVREYDGIIEDVVIVKTPKTVSVDVPKIDAVYGCIYSTIAENNGTGNRIYARITTEIGNEKIAFAPTVKFSCENGETVALNISEIASNDIDSGNVSITEKLSLSDLANQVVRITKNLDGEIEAIALADYDDSFKKSDITAGEYRYDEENSSLGNAIDDASSVFFIGTDSESCSVGSTLDLTANESYRVLAMYKDGTTAEDNIIVIRGEKPVFADNPDTSELNAKYGYVYNTLVTDKNMDAEVLVKLITDDGVELLNFASNVIVNYKNNGKTTFKVQNITDSELAAADATLYGATKVSDMIGQVIKFTKNSNGDIRTIIFADHNESFESVKITAAEYYYDADNLTLGKPIDSGSKIFFIGTAADRSSTGVLDDLTDDESYHVLAIYRDSSATNNNIVLIRGENPNANYDDSDDSDVSEANAKYGYVYNTLVTDNNMDAEVLVKLITDDGVELLNFASNVIVNYKNNGKTTFKVQNITGSELAAADATLYGTTKVSAMIGQVVKFTKNSNGDIKTITFADYNDNFESVKVTSGKYRYDADNLKLGKYIDEASEIFFIGTAADKCYIGTPAELSDNNIYEVLAMYADSNAVDNNIVVIKGTNNTASASANLAIITDISLAKNENGDDILVLSYISENATVENVETIEDVTVIGADASWLSADDLTVGDIVQIKVGGSGKRAGKITGITVLWDFKEDVRVDYDTYFVRRAFTCADADEVLYGGAVTVAYDADKVYFGTDLDWGKKDGEGNMVALTDQVSNWVNIGKAQNVYTIQTVRDGNVSFKEGGSFNYIKQMFDNTGDYSFYYNGEDTGVMVSKYTVDDYVDYVFVREYDGRIEDVVIVKPPKKVSVKAN